MPEPLKYGKWYHVRNEYLVGSTPGYLDSNGAPRGCTTNYLDVSISAKKDRVGQGTGIWRIIPASDSPAGPPRNYGDVVMIGDYFYLQNCYGEAGYMEVCGDCGACTSNRYDVSLTKVRHREGAGSKNAIWQFWGNRAAPLSEGESIHISSAYSDNNFLDVCGSYSPGIRNDVSTHSSPNRLNALTGTWSVIPYDSSDYDALLETQEDIPPHTIRIEKIQCVLPSSGVSGPQAFATAFGILGGAIGGASSAVVWGGLTAATAGAATPLAVFMVALITTEASALGAAVGAGAQAAASKIGQLLPDQAYITVDGNKVWPSGTYTNVNAGDILDVKWQSTRGQGTVINIWEHDVFLSDDLLYEWKFLPGTELVNCPLVDTRPELGSSYILYLTVTGNRSSRQILRDAHNTAMQRTVPAVPAAERGVPLIRPQST